MINNVRKDSWWITMLLPYGTIQTGAVETAIGRAALRIVHVSIVFAGISIGCNNAGDSALDASLSDGDSTIGTSAPDITEYTDNTDDETKWSGAADSDTTGTIAADSDTTETSADVDTTETTATNEDSDSDSDSETDAHIDSIGTTESDPVDTGVFDSDEITSDSDTQDSDAVTSDDDTSGDISTEDGDSSVNHDSVRSEGCGADSPSSGDFTIDVKGTTREYTVEIPSNYDPNTPYRLVFAWHGLGGTAAMTARGWFGLESYSNDSAIFIAGQAQSGSGGMGGMASWAIHPDESDMDYTRAMVEWAKENYCIDTERVFSIGVSNGGMMSNIVGCELGEIFRGIAVIAGGGPEGYATTPCKGQVAAWITHGNQDNNVPFSYGEKSRDYWVGANNCGTETEVATPDECLEYQGCDDGYPVQFCEHDGGHTVPSFTGEAAWNFFAGL